MGNTTTGVDVILEGLNRRFGQLDVESSITTIIELLTFRRNHWESIDEALTRFELLRSRTDANAAGFQMPEAVLAWQLLVALNIPRTVWPLLFHFLAADYQRLTTNSRTCALPSGNKATSPSIRMPDHAT